MDELAWPAMAPWLSIQEWADLMYVDRSTVSRKAAEWRKDGLVVCRNEGRLLRPRDRFIHSTGGLDQLFPDRHTHPGRLGHTHDPLDDFLAHGHPSYFNGYAGALALYQRLHLIETWYPLAPRVLQGAGAKWTHDGRARRILSWRWLRHARFIHAVGTYEDDYKLFFCDIGRSLTSNSLRRRWVTRFQDDRGLVKKSRGEMQWRQLDWLREQPDPDEDYDPIPSVYVITTPDYRGVELALEVLPNSHTYIYVVGPPDYQQVIYGGKMYPAPHDDVADRFEDVDVGIPQDLCL